MAKLAFGTHDQVKIVAAVEAMLRQETGAADPVAYTVEDEHTITAATARGEVIHAVLGGRRSAIQLFTIHFQLRQPRTAELWVQINKQGIGAYAGSLLYAVDLVAPPVAAEVRLEPGKATFEGDATASAKLNADPTLAKDANKLLHARLQVGGGTISITPACRILPAAGSLLVLHTLFRSTNLGFSATLDAPAVFALAARLEAAL